MAGNEADSPRSGFVDEGLHQPVINVEFEQAEPRQQTERVFAAGLNASDRGAMLAGSVQDVECAGRDLKPPDMGFPPLRCANSQESRQRLAIAFIQGEAGCRVRGRWTRTKSALYDQTTLRSKTLLKISDGIPIRRVERERSLYQRLRTSRLCVLAEPKGFSGAAPLQERCSLP